MQIDFIAALVALLYSALVVGIPQLGFLAELWVQPAAAAAAGLVALTRWRGQIISRREQPNLR